jgi:glycerol-3-phosphate O-acyltransferase/dihydroxyacetone phosphate acyltransferase
MSITDRAVRFLCAAWSMRQPYIGDIARALKAIPVERAMDIAKQGPGRVTISGQEVTGDEQTDFIASGLTAGWSLLVREESLVVERVVDAHHLQLQHPSDRGEFAEPQSYFFAPRIDQGQVFANVWDSLGAGDCVGIFPEGGSHDQSAFLPFKAGVAVMALGACVQHPGLPLRILPVGLNYFQGWKFRSRVYLDIGDAIVPSQQQIDGYKAGGEQKKAAIAELLEQVHHGLKLVTATAPSYEVLHLLWAIRRLYTPDDVRLTVTQKLELTRRFEQYYDRMKDTPEAKELRERVIGYNDRLALLGLRDHQLKAAADDSRESRPQLLTLLLQRVTMLLALTVAALPGGLLNLPTVVVARLVSARKAKQAIAEGMGIKLEGKDVMATWGITQASAHCGCVRPLCCCSCR